MEQACIDPVLVALSWIMYAAAYAIVSFSTVGVIGLWKELD